MGINIDLLTIGRFKHNVLTYRIDPKIKNTSKLISCNERMTFNFRPTTVQGARPNMLRAMSMNNK